MNETSPCKGCPDRQVACHGSCERYKAWRERFVAQQKHLSDNKYRWSRPWSNGREKKARDHLKFGGTSHHKGGNNG